MIYQLLLRDPAWRLMPFAAAAGGLCIWADSGAMGLSLFATLLIVWPLLAAVQRRATLFQAALPIPARNLFAARCVGFGALVWLPVLAAAGVAFLKAGSEWQRAVLVPIECGAAATLTLVALLSLRLIEVESPPQLVIPQCYLGGGICAAAFLLFPAAPVLAVFAAASLALFARAWRAMPESFQVAPLAAGKPSRRSHAASARPIPWLILLRSAVTLRSFLFLPLICQTIFMHPASWPAVCFFGPLVSGLGQPHHRWLNTAPIPRWKLLAIAAAIANLVVMVPYSVSIAFGRGGHTSLRLGLINLFCMMAASMSGLILMVAWGNYRIRLLPLWVRLGALIPAGITIFLAGPGVAVLHLSRTLPENPAAIPILGAVAFAAMFRLLEKLDAQAEWPEMLNRREPGSLTFLKLN